MNNSLYIQRRTYAGLWRCASYAIGCILRILGRVEWQPVATHIGSRPEQQRRCRSLLRQEYRDNAVDRYRAYNTNICHQQRNNSRVDICLCQVLTQGIERGKLYKKPPLYYDVK